MNTAAYHPQAPIEAHEVPDDARIHTLPRHFGQYMFTVGMPFTGGCVAWRRSTLAGTGISTSFQTVASTWPLSASPCCFASRAMAMKGL